MRLAITNFQPWYPMRLNSATFTLALIVSCRVDESAAVSGFGKPRQQPEQAYLWYGAIHISGGWRSGALFGFKTFRVEDKRRSLGRCSKWMRGDKSAGPNDVNVYLQVTASLGKARWK